MLALRRSPNPIRSWCYHVCVTRTCSAKLGVLPHDLQDRAIRQDKKYFAACSFLSMPFSSGCSFSTKTISECRSLSAQAGASSSSSSSDSESDFEDGFSELEEPLKSDKDEVQDNGEGDDKSPSRKENDREDVNMEANLDENEALGSLGPAADVGENSIEKGEALYNRIMGAPLNFTKKVITKYAKEGNSIGHDEVGFAMAKLRRWRNYPKALQLSEWLEENKTFDMVERDYACRVDTIAKVHGLCEAEKYIDKLTEEFKTEVVYRTLLANCALSNDLKKTEQVFDKMRTLGFPLSAYACNQLIILYKRFNRQKLADILLMMEKEGVKATLLTYKLLIDTKGRTNDMEGIEQIVETMKTEGMEPDQETLAVVAKYYIFGGLAEKAEAVLKEIEREHIKENRPACKLLLPLYAALGKADEVERIWKVCVNPRKDERSAAIEAWGALGQVGKAEEIFKDAIRDKTAGSQSYYTALLKVYENHKLLNKGKELVKQMSSKGIRIGPWIWDSLVKLYLKAGEVEKADSLLRNAEEKAQVKPMYITLVAILDKYAKRGDIHNAEKIFHKLKSSSNPGNMRIYQVLLEAYINAKTPAYGFRERMKADNLFPNKLVAGQLKTIDGFTKNTVADILD